MARHRWAVLGGAVAFFLFCAAGLGRLQFNDNYRIFFDNDNPHLQALDDLEDTYAKEEVMLLVVAPEDGNVFSRESLTAVDELTEKSWQIPLSTRVDSITNFQHTRADGDDIAVEELAEDPAAMSDEELARVREKALAEPLLVDRLVSPDGDTTAVAVTFVLPGLSGGERTEPVAFARNLIAEMGEKYPNIKFVANGGLVLSYAFTEYTERDTATLTPLQFAVVFILIAVFLRSLVCTVCAVVIIVFSVASAMGLSGWFGLDMTAPAAAMPTIVLTLAVADCVHILVILLGVMRSGMQKDDALIETIRVNLAPIFITSLTTVIGFLSMNFNSVPPLRDFGNMTAMGITAAFIYSITLLPAMLAILPLRARGTDRRASVNPIAEFVIRNRRRVLYAGAAFTVIIGMFALRNDFTNNWVQWFDAKTPFRQDLEFVEEHLSGINAIEFSLPAGEAGGVAKPEYLQALDDFAVWARQQPNVSHASTLADILKQVNRSMHGDDPAYYKVPETQDLASQYLLLYEMSLPYGQDLNNQINVDKSATRLTIITKQVDSHTLNELSRECENWLRENAPPYMRATATGNGPMFASIAEDTIRGMVRGTPTALLFVSLALIAAFRSFRYGLLSIIPNLAPMIAAYGIWGLTTGRIDFGVAAVGGLGIGVVVDDTVHFMSKYLRARRDQGLSPEESVRYAFRNVGRAMWVTTFILISGFAVLATSSFNFNANMGMLGAIAVTLALVGDSFLLPAILLTVDNFSAKKTEIFETKATQPKAETQTA